MATSITSSLFLCFGLALVAYSLRLWKRWIKNKNTPMLRLSKGDKLPASNLQPLHKQNAPRSPRWPSYRETSTYDEAVVYAYFAKWRSDYSALYGDLLLALGSALLGSTAMTFMISGPSASLAIKIGFPAGLLVAGCGIILARLNSKRWNEIAYGYERAAKLHARGARRVRRRSKRAAKIAGRNTRNIN